MSKLYQSPRAVCPFYKGEESQTVYCEGVLGASSLRLSFADAKSAQRYKCRNCCDDFENCAVYSVILAVYDEEESKRDKLRESKRDAL